MWGFIICKLDKGAENYHPFGYTHNILNGKIFVPTKHYHQEPAKQQPISLNKKAYNEFNIDSSPMFSAFMPASAAGAGGWPANHSEGWDHDIYLLNCITNSGINGSMSFGLKDANTECIVDQKKLNFNFGKQVKFQKLHLVGENYPNIDIVVQTA